ncbi:MAG TPA: hypothetical protein P5137_00710, partial [Candidatus Brocadiia bacterium]|nr:hypothetical protein [Candidatus Brocadiia bacterium]
IDFSDRSVSMIMDLARRHCRILAYGGASLAEAKLAASAAKGTHTITFEFDHGWLRARLDGQEVAAAADPAPGVVGGQFEMSFWDHCKVRRVRMEAEEPAQARPAARDDFMLEVNVDFFDDLMHAPFTTDMFDQLFAEFRSWGVSRVHWIYYGGSKRGWWSGAPMGVAENAAKTVANAGEIFPAAVSAAHEHGIELYGLVKPFDMGFWRSVGEGDPRAGQGRLRRVGGVVGWIADFVAQRRDLCMARKPGAYGAARNDVFHRIDIIKEDDAAADFGVKDLRLFVSDDNTRYKLYTGPMSREEKVEDYPVWEHTSSGGRPTGACRRARVLRLKDLELRSKYFVVAVESRSGSFANDLINMIHVFGPQGEERLLSYGVEARGERGRPKGANAEVVRQGFEDMGVEFDVWPGMPSAVLPGFDGVRARKVLDSGQGFVAVARGKDREPVACLSPSYPEAREWWLGWVRDCIDAGADGVELRVRNHHSPLAWAEFGFEEPVVRAFKDLYGVDLLSTDDFDDCARQRLRGEAYTEFYRQAKKLVASRGKKLGLHISQTMCIGPEFGSAMGIHWDWRRWLEEGLADSVTLKEVWPQSRFGQEVLSVMRPRRVPGVFCPYANNLWKAGDGVAVCASRIRQAREAGLAGFQYYECASVVRGTEDGRIVMEQPGLRDLFRREFASRSVPRGAR